MAVTTWDALKLRGSDAILRWMPGESRRLRIVDNQVYSIAKHWVPTKDESGAERDMPFVCLGADCERVLLPDGSVLHDTRTDIEYRCFVWDWTLGGELRILAGKVQIFDGLKHIRKEFGDLSKFDVMVACEPAKGVGGRKYTVSACPGAGAELTDEILTAIANGLSDMAEFVDPLPLSVDDVAQRLGGKVLYPTEDESLADSEPPAEEA